MAATHRAAFADSRPWSEAEFSDLLSQPVCYSTGDARCFALIRGVLDDVELLTIATHPNHQRQGLACLCMANWQAKAHDQGATRAFLEVAADNTGAIALYQDCGFETNGTRPGYYRRERLPPVDALLMIRCLP